MDKIEALPKNFCPIKNTIIDGLCRIKLTCYEWNILMVIIRKTYGWSNGDGSRKILDYISLNQFEEATGILKPHISRTLKLLLARKIIIRNKDLVGVNKSVDNWCDLPYQVTKQLPHQVSRVTLSGKRSKREKLPDRVTTKEIKETYTKENNKNILISSHKEIQKNIEGLKKHAPKNGIISVLRMIPKDRWDDVRRELISSYRNGEIAFNDARNEVLKGGARGK